MRLRNPLIALGILAGLSAYVYIVEIKGGEKRRKEKEAGEHVLPVRPDDVTGLTLVRAGERVRLEKVAGKWKIQEPRAAEPDPSAVDEILRSLEDLHISHDLGKRGDLSTYNLESPAVRLEVQAAAKSAVQPLSLGDEAPTGGGTYARLGDSDRVLVVSGAYPLQSAGFFSLRDKTFLKFDPSRLRRFRILRGRDGIDLSRAEGQWRIAAPIRAPADDSAVFDILFALGRLAVTEFVEEKPDSASLPGRGLAPPGTRVLLAGDEWEGEKELTFGNAEGGSLFALHPATNALVKVPDGIEAKLKSAVADLRKKDLLPFSRFDISRFRITGVAPEPLELERKDEREWKRISPSPGVIADEVVGLLLRNLGDLKAESFVDRPDREMSRYGLEPPAAKLEFWKKGQEKGQPSTVAVGRPDGKGRVPMRDPAWPPVMMVPAASWGQTRDQALKVSEEKPEPEVPAPGTSPAKSSAPGTPAASGSSGR